jgi:hypothetical protein
MKREVRAVGVVVKPPDESFRRLETAIYYAPRAHLYRR